MVTSFSPTLVQAFTLGGSTRLVLPVAGAAPGQLGVENNVSSSAGQGAFAPESIETCT